MATKSLNGVLRHLRKLAGVQGSRALCDQVLLTRFVASGDEASFTALIERHGRMVLGVCRRALGNLHDAEDACQATFLVLARKAASIRQTSSLSGWLHGVACRVAADLKRDQARRRRHERALDAPVAQDAAAEVSWREVQAILDEEMERLAERYRTPLILCYLDGKARDEAAQQLGLSLGGLHGRLERGRDLLRRRLVQRGLTLSAALLATALGDSAAHAALSATTVVGSTKAAMLLVGGQPLPHGLVAAKVLTLTQGVLKTMFLTKLKVGTAAVLCTGLFAALCIGSFTSAGIAQDAKYPPASALLVRLDPGPAAKPESDADFLRRVTNDLRGSAPTPLELHFFLANKDAGKRQRAIDLLIQERQAKKDAQAKSAETQLLLTRVVRAQALTRYTRVAEQPPRLATYQQKFFKDVVAAGGKGEVAKITQTYLDRLGEYVKDHPKNADVPDAMLQIVRVYESQGKTVEANAWRDKLLKDHPNSSAAKTAK